MCIGIGIQVPLLWTLNISIVRRLILRIEILSHPSSCSRVAASHWLLGNFVVLGRCALQCLWHRVLPSVVCWPWPLALFGFYPIVPQDRFAYILVLMITQSQTNWPKESVSASLTKLLSFLQQRVDFIGLTGRLIFCLFDGVIDLH